MPGLHATLRRSGGLDALSRRLAMPPADVASAAARLLPPLLIRYRRLYDAAGAGLAGVRVIAELTARFGGGELAMKLLAGAPIPPEAATGFLAGVLAPGESADVLIAEAGAAAEMAEAMAALLPPLNLLVGSYLTARAEAAADGTEDIATEFERLFAGDIQAQ
jgi:hypothetical protein